MTVLGGGGAYPTPERGCSGYVVEHAGFRLLVDPGYGTLPVLLTHLDANEIDAVFVSHSHGDHCVELNPLLRVRHLRPDPAPPLPVIAAPGAVDAVLALDGPMLTADWVLREIVPGQEMTVGPLHLHVRALAHFVDNLGVRIEAGAAALAYTGDGGADSAVAELAEGADVLLAEASFADVVPQESAGLLGSARQAGEHAAAAGVAALVLTHLLPATDQAQCLRAARRAYSGPITVAVPGYVIEVGNQQ